MSSGLGGGRGGGSPLGAMGGFGSALSGLSGAGSGLMRARPPGHAGVVPPGSLPPGAAPEKGLQKDTILAARAISAAFPEIEKIGGVRADSLKWHPNGLAVDVMIPNPTSARGKALGDAVLRFVMEHRQEFNLNHAIWQQRLHNPDGSSYVMDNRGTPTQNHMDHVHVATNGGGYPRGGETYRMR